MQVEESNSKALFEFKEKVLKNDIYFLQKLPISYFFSL